LPRTTTQRSGRRSAAARSRRTTATGLLIGTTAAALVLGCAAILPAGGSGQTARVHGHTPPWVHDQMRARHAAQQPPAAGPWRYRETGDLDALAARGHLRILVLDRHRVRGPGGTDLERELIEQFARDRGLQPLWVPLATRDELARALLDGRGDVAVEELPLQYDVRAEIAYTAPLRAARYVAVTCGAGELPASTSDLAGQRVGLRRSSPIAAVLARLAGANTGIDLRPQPDYRPDRELLAALCAGELDAVVGTRDRLGPLRGDFPALRIAFSLTDDRPVAWSTRAAATELRAALDEHLHRSALVRRRSPTFAGDLAGIRDRGVLRVVTRRDGVNYFLEGGDPAGFEYDLATRFALHEGLRLEVMVADSVEAMTAALKDGRADLIIARTAASRAGADPALAVSRAYYHVAPTLVTRRTGAIENLAGARVLVHPALTDPLLLESLRAGAAEFELDVATPDTPVQDVLDAVAGARFDATVIDSTHLAGLLRERDELVAGASLDEQHLFRWTMRAASTELAAHVDGFLRREFRSAHFNVLRHRYFNEPLSALALAGGAGDLRISPFDSLARRYAERYGFDWRLLVAQMFQESGFDPHAESAAGAVGLMQVLPPTAREMGFTAVSLREPAVAVHAGTKYLYWLRARFEEDLPIADRTWFALAAYHAGYERVRRARREAAHLGLDPDRWFDNVEQAMKRMALDADGRYIAGAAALRTVAYVRRIRARYEAYLELTLPIRLTAVTAAAGDTG